MINHLRTVLLNLSATENSQDAPGWEYISPQFQPVGLRPPLWPVWRAIFGSTPDATGLNFRFRQLLPILHSPDLEPYTLRPDRRLTYARVDDVFFSLPPGLSVVAIPGTLSVDLTCPQSLLTTPNNDLRQQWSGSVVTTRTPNLSPALLEIVAGDPTPTPLPGAIQAAVTWRSGEPGTNFMLTLLRRPQLGLADLPSALETVLHAEASTALFGVDPAAPYDLFYSWWRNSTQLQYRLGGVLLALAYRLSPSQGV